MGVSKPDDETCVELENSASRSRMCDLVRCLDSVWVVESEDLDGTFRKMDLHFFTSSLFQTFNSSFFNILLGQQDNLTSLNVSSLSK